MKPIFPSHRTVSSALLLAFAAFGSAQTLYAGPSWDQTTGYGYRQPYLSTRPGGTAGAGYGIGSIIQAAPRALSELAR